MCVCERGVGRRFFSIKKSKENVVCGGGGGGGEEEMYATERECDGGEIEKA